MKTKIQKDLELLYDKYDKIYVKLSEAEASDLYALELCLEMIKG